MRLMVLFLLAVLINFLFPGISPANFDGSDDFSSPQINESNWKGWSNDTDYGAFYIQTGQLALDMDWDGGGSSEVAGGMIWKPNSGDQDQDWNLCFEVEVPEFTVVTSSMDYEMFMSLRIMGTDPSITQEYYPTLALGLIREWDGYDFEFNYSIQAAIELSLDESYNLIHQIPEDVTKASLRISWNANSDLLSTFYQLADGSNWWNQLGSWNIQSGVIDHPDGVFIALVSGELDGFRGLPDIYTPRASTWNAQPHSWAGDRGVAVLGDYNGDGSCDPAVFRPSNGLWKIRNITQAYFGNSSDIPVPHDYDGDGTWDMAYFRASSELWKIRGLTRIYFGTLGDTPIPGDFDGDGTAEPGFFRADDRLWKVRGLTRLYFGNSTDCPVSY